jgi:hypothetical protein
MNHPAPMRRQALEAGGYSYNGNILFSMRKGRRCKVWARRPAVVEVPLTLYHDGITFDVWGNSSDRAKIPQGARDAWSPPHRLQTILHKSARNRCIVWQPSAVWTLPDCDKLID